MISLPAYHILHLSAIFVLLGYSFYAFAAPAETRKRVLMITGVAALLVLVTGFGMMARMQLPFHGWLIVKFVCWLGLAAVAGPAYRARRFADPIMIGAFALAIIAVAMAYLKPF